MLKHYDDLPVGLLDCEATELHGFLKGPSLIHLSGQRKPALFVSVLMHGNETTGWDAVCQLLKRYCHGSQVELPRALSLFIANTEAAEKGVRHLASQPDFNRVWPGSELPHTDVHELMQSVHQEMSDRDVFVSVDVHNNTGLNPHYACVNTLDSATLQLATLFSRTVVYFTRPVGVQSLAMSSICPAVTLECGKAEQDLGTEHAVSYLDACLHLSELPASPVAEHDLDLFHTTATVKVRESVRFGFEGENLDFKLSPQIEKYNFTELDAGTAFGESLRGVPDLLSVTDESGANVYEDYFDVSERAVRTRKKVMPSMLTSNLEVIKQDCLCYLMERYSLSAA